MDVPRRLAPGVLTCGGGADVLALEFEALAAEPGRVLGALARVCRTVPFGRIDAAPVNRAERARFAPPVPAGSCRR